MKIEPLPPFRLSEEPDGTGHAVQDAIGVSVLPDVGRFRLRHRVGENPERGAQRWLIADLEDRGVKIFVHGTHVVITTRDLLPTFNE